MNADPTPERAPAQAAPTVDVVLSVYDGERYVEEQIRSLQEQTHAAWRLWARDDGSSDGSHALLERLAAEDERIRVHPRDGRNLGAAGCYGWLLEHLPDDARWVFCCDADDVWLPEKVERTLAALMRADTGDGAPVLVHTDLRVVDERLGPIADSFWQMVGIDPATTGLEYLRIRNVATGPTIAMNRELAEMVVPIPPASPHHDWWITLVAAAFGRIVAVPETTVLYRRHAANVTGLAGRSRGLLAVLQKLPGAAARAAEVRRWVGAAAEQSRIFLERFGDRLTPEQAALMREAAELDTGSSLERRRRILSVYAGADRGLLHALGMALRG